MAEQNFQNRTIFHGDNLDFLRNINSASVDLIATDPPFNKNKDFHAASNTKAAGASFTDRWHWDDDVLPQWQDSLKDDKPETWHFINGVRGAGHDDMAAFLCWLGVRLMECHRILRPDGSLYLHIDHTAHAYAKVLMDTIFGRDNFRNELVWGYNKWTNAANYFQRNHDTILFYAKSEQVAFTKQYWMTEHKQKVVARGWDSNKVQGGVRQLLVYDRIKAGKEIQNPKYDKVVYRDDANPGTAMSDVWSDIKYLSSASKERTGYPTQKPLALYERIIKASSNEGDMVLDPFCGCATTPVAAERLGRQWIGMDTWEKTHQVVLDRLNAEKRIFGEDAIQLVNDPNALERTDDEEVAAEYLPPIYRRSRQSSISRADMMDILVGKWGLVCWGCGFVPPHIDFLELDHNDPASGGGSNELYNRAPLCSPCNRLKSNIYTLDGLRRENRKLKRWYWEEIQEIDLRQSREWAERYLEEHPRQAKLAVSA